MIFIRKILQNSIDMPFKVAIKIRDESKTYSQLSSDIRRLASYLSINLINSNNIVLIEAENSYNFIITYCAVHLSGGVAVIVSPESTEYYKKTVVSKTNACLHINSVSSFVAEASVTSEKFDREINGDALADLIYTSGTTGEPKGVRLTHAQLTLATEHIIDYVGNTVDDVELLLMPLAHSFGMGRMRSTLFAGGTLILGYPFKKLKQVFKAIEQHNVTGLGFVPSAWFFIKKMSGDIIKKYSGQIRYIELGSAPLSIEDKDQIRRFFPDTHIVMHYGLTEVSRALFVCFTSDDLSASGRIDGTSQVRILRSLNNIESDNSQDGEILLKSPWMFDGYYEQPLLSNDSLHEGFFKTGDIGRISGNYLYLTGRLKEIINVGGKKVSPEQVERIYHKSDLIKEIACISMGNSDSGESVQAFIVLKNGEDSHDERVIEQLQDLARKELPVYMRPKKYTIVLSIPKTPSGKFQRLKLLR